MIAAIVAHLRRRVWHHDGSGGELVDIQNMGVNGKGKKPTTRKTENIDNNRNATHPPGNGGLQEDESDKDDDMSASEGQEIKGVKGVKKYTRRYNGRQKRRNYERAMARGNAHDGFWQVTDVYSRDSPTDYSDSETDGPTGRATARARAIEAIGIDAAIEQLATMVIEEYRGSAKKKIHWLQAVKSEILYDWNGVNKDLRLIDLPIEDEDRTFYGRLTRDILIKYKVKKEPSIANGSYNSDKLAMANDME
jgi:hypothetical protein